MTRADKYFRRSVIRGFLFPICFAALVSACGEDSSRVGSKASQVGSVATKSSPASPVIAETDWPLGGGESGKPHYSELSQINRETVADLSLAWALPVASPLGLSSEPIVVGGIAYISAPFSVVRAVDVRSGKELWTFTPEIDLTYTYARSWTARTNRGVAVSDGLVYVGIADCRVIAIDADTGSAVWETQVCNKGENKKAGITGAPAVGNGLVFIGYFGSSQKMRGALIALDAKTGEEKWRFWTVPNGDGTVENEAMARAAKSWGDSTPQGGGTVWDAITFDAQTNRVYFGTGSRSPYLDSDGKPYGGDNLYASSIVAVDARTGDYIWHYQTTPGDIWDFDATMHIALVDMKFADGPRRVAMAAPKNGFFYVLDAGDGELISADPIVRVTWASHVDLETGRPVLNPEAQFYNFPGQRTRVFPGSIGAHNWHAMAVDRESGTVFIPANDLGGYFGIYADGSPWYDASGFDADGNSIEDAGRLIAWDVANKAPRWTINLRKPFNGGTLATAGGLVFFGESTGVFAAYDVDSGTRLWEYQTSSPVSSNPVTVSLDGEQYILQNFGQSSGITMTDGSLTMTEKTRGGHSMLLAFKLNGSGKMPELEQLDGATPMPPRLPDEDQVAAGKELWRRAGCGACHGFYVSGVGTRRLNGGIPDLRYSPEFVHDQWLGILYGARLDKGMPSYAGLYEPEEALAIQEFVLQQSWDRFCGEQALQAAREAHEYCVERAAP